MNPNALLDIWTTTMWNTCWQGSLVVLAVWLICQVIPSMPARCRCWLWRLAILKFIVVLLLPTLVNLPLLPAPPVTDPIPEVAVQVVTPQVPVSPIEQVEFRPGREVELPRLRAILAFLWIIGVGWSLACLLVSWQGVRRLRKQSLVIETTPLIEQMAIQARLYGLRTSPALLETEGDGSPMLIGILRPAIVVPGGTLRKLSPAELAMVLGHELAHIRRADLLWRLAAAAVRTVFFFHPLVWLSQRRLNLSQEVAADELAILRQLGDPVSYGKCIGGRSLANAIDAKNLSSYRGRRNSSYGATNKSYRGAGNVNCYLRLKSLSVAYALVPARWAAEDVFSATAARMSALSAFSSISSPSWKSMARLVLPSRLELKRPEGSSNEAPLAKVIFTTFLYVSPVQIIRS